MCNASPRRKPVAKKSTRIRSAAAPFSNGLNEALRQMRAGGHTLHLRAQSPCRSLPDADLERLCVGKIGFVVVRFCPGDCLDKSQNLFAKASIIDRQNAALNSITSRGSFESLLMGWSSFTVSATANPSARQDHQKRSARQFPRREQSPRACSRKLGWSRARISESADK